MALTTSYRAARWYDAYPKLAFAFKLLQVMPRHLQHHILQQLQNHLVWTDPTTIFSTEPHAIRRTEDDDTLFWHIVNHIRHGSEGQKHHAAECILNTLAHVA